MLSVTELGEIIKKDSPDLAFSMLEVGSRPMGSETEPSHILLDIFPNSKVIAFERDEDECIRMNQQAKQGLTYYPVTLGQKNEERNFYETIHPMRSSMYEPNEDLISDYNALEGSYFKKKHLITTEALDVFLKQENIQDIDFMKVNIQGAELDMFKGAKETLQSTLFIVSDVKFIPLYKDQPLFGDVSKYLNKKGLKYHHLINNQGRTLKPMTLNNDPFFISQHMSSDAFFIRDTKECDALNSTALLKICLFSYIYGITDLSLYYLKMYDEREGSNLFNDLLTG